jgi:hypothetical protein
MSVHRKMVKRFASPVYTVVVDHPLPGAQGVFHEFPSLAEAERYALLCWSETIVAGSADAIRSGARLPALLLVSRSVTPAQWETGTFARRLGDRLDLFLRPAA